MKDIRKATRCSEIIVNASPSDISKVLSENRAASDDDGQITARARRERSRTCGGAKTSRRIDKGLFSSVEGAHFIPTPNGVTLLSHLPIKWPHCG
jgi:hypothetical protein